MSDTAYIELTDIEARVLGALVEKEATTPDYYPLSLNALTNACNQKSNREPVMNLDDESVREALSGLEEKGLAGPARGVDSRVTKYEHRWQEVFNLSRPETALLCVLLLRGPQTPGELRGRTERIYRFDDLDAVDGALTRLMQRDVPLVKKLPRQPGTKESRYAHLLCGDVQADDAPASEGDVEARDGGDHRVARLESEVEALRDEVQNLKQQFADFRKQFE